MHSCSRALNLNRVDVFFIIIESIDLEEMNNKKNLRISIRTKIEANWSFNYYYNWLCLELKKK